MGDANTTLTPETAAHLLRRTGFGATPKQVQDLLEDFPTRGAAATHLLDFTPKKFKPSGRETSDKQNNWLKYMLKIKTPLQEKLVLFWHDHFATSDAVVEFAAFMAAQNRTLRLGCKGNFRDLVKAINKDPAMIKYLNTNDNRKFSPNENYARELQELFTLGVHDFNGQTNYDQADIVQIARAFTGWFYDDSNTIGHFNDSQHDYTDEFDGDPEEDRGPKVVYQNRSPFGAGGANITQNGEGSQEIDTVVDILFQHQDSEGKNTVARRTCRRLLEYFCHGGFADGGVVGVSASVKTAVDTLITASSFDTTFDISALLYQMMVSDVFYETYSPVPLLATTKRSVKWPVDFVVGTLRQLGMTTKGRELEIQGGNFNTLPGALSDMGQEVLFPPSVFGWDWEHSWLSSSRLLARYAFVRDVASARGSGSKYLRPAKLLRDVVDFDQTAADPEAIVTAITNHFFLTDQFATAEHDVLLDFLTDNGANPTIDLTNEDVVNEKIHGLFALVMQSPQYQLQ